MSILEAILFGIVQGVTEFLPISSTAHIIITEHLLGLQFPGLGFEVFLHLGSVLAVILYYRRELRLLINGSIRYFSTKSDEDRVQLYFSLYIVVATLITGILGLLLQNIVDQQMKGNVFIAVFLFLTGVFLIVIERFHEVGKRDEGQMSWLDSIIVGLAQSFSVMPGLSRSGTTLIVGLWIGLNRDTAVRYSFLLSIPVILGSTVLALSDVSMDMFRSIGAVPLVITFATTFLCSLIGIKWLIAFLKQSKLVYFALYCFFLALMVYIFM